MPMKQAPVRSKPWSLGRKPPRQLRVTFSAFFTSTPCLSPQDNARSRGAFPALMRRIVFLVSDQLAVKTGLPPRHPILRFVSEPTVLANALLLDDTVFWGSLPLLLEADDEEIRRLAFALRDRRVNNCIDLRALVEANLPVKTNEPRQKRNARIKIICDDEIVNDLKQVNERCSSEKAARFLIDQYVRNPYKRFQDSRTPLNQILIRLSPDKVTDMAELSPVIAHAEPFSLSRVYTFRDDTESRDVIENIMRTKIQEGGELERKATTCRCCSNRPRCRWRTRWANETSKNRVPDAVGGFRQLVLI